MKLSLFLQTGDAINKYNLVIFLNFKMKKISVMEEFLSLRCFSRLSSVRERPGGFTP